MHTAVDLPELAKFSASTDVLVPVHVPSTGTRKFSYRY
eukprot:SAG11_NODE_804_length_7096_cov_14.131056_1_plen_38_part_00